MQAISRAKWSSIIVQIFGLIVMIYGSIDGVQSLLSSRSTRECVTPFLTREGCYVWGGKAADWIEFRFGVATIFCGLLGGFLLLMTGAFVEMRTRSLQDPEILAK